MRRMSGKGILMRLVRLRAPGGLENLKLVEEDHPKPSPGELLVRIRASSLNFHDDMVVLGKIPCADGRIPMSDGAGEVIAVGDDVDEFKVADTVVSTFWRSCDRGRRTRHIDAVDNSLQDGRAYRHHRRLDGYCGGSVDPGSVFESDSYQRDLHWQQSRSRGHDSGDNRQSFEARYRPPFSAAGNRRCLQVLRIPKALWQGLPRTLRFRLSTAGCGSHCSKLYALVRGHALHGRALHHAVLQRRIGLQLAHGQLAPGAPGKEHAGVRVEHRVRVRQPLAPVVHRIDLLKVVVEAFLAHGLDAGKGGFVLGVALGPADVGVGGMYAGGEKSDMR